MNIEEKEYLNKALNQVEHRDYSNFIEVLENSISVFLKDFDKVGYDNLEIVEVNNLDDMKSNCSNIFESIDKSNKKIFRDKRLQFCGNIILDLENRIIENHLSSSNDMFHEIISNIRIVDCICNYSYKKENIEFVDSEDGLVRKGFDIYPKKYRWISRGLYLYIFQDTEWIQEGSIITEWIKCNFKIYVYIDR